MYRILDFLSLTLSSRESILGHFKLKLLIFHYLRYIYLRELKLLIQEGVQFFFFFFFCLIDVHYHMYRILDFLSLTFSIRSPLAVISLRNDPKATPDLKGLNSKYPKSDTYDNGHR
ncbi:unnamed protein product [Meganyctiphanes norvegica]|uniref:Uncharacterized protein n=1 Tax=Meganyctiphanes norvegica TaxID=48144 RepID=A0AAV2SCM5_MEGNR